MILFPNPLLRIKPGRLPPLPTISRVTIPLLHRCNKLSRSQICVCFSTKCYTLLRQVFKLIWSAKAAVVSLAEIFILHHCRSSSDLIPQQQSKAMAAEDTTRKQHFHNTLEWVAGRLSELS